MGKTATAKAPVSKKKTREQVSHLHVVDNTPQSRPRWIEFAGIVLLAIGVLLIVALLTYSPVVPGWEPQARQHNLVGPAGALLAELLFAAVGMSAYLIVGGVFFAGLCCFTTRPVRTGTAQVSGALLALFGGSIIAHLSLASTGDIPYPPGGFIGAVGGDLLTRALAQLGAAIVSATALAIGMLLFTNVSLTQVFVSLGNGLLHSGEIVVDWTVLQRERLRQRKQKRAEFKALAIHATEDPVEPEQNQHAQRALAKQQRRQDLVQRAAELAEQDLEKEHERALRVLTNNKENVDTNDANGVVKPELVIATPETGTIQEAEVETAPAPAIRTLLSDPPWADELNYINDTDPGSPAPFEDDETEVGTEVEASGAPRIVASNLRTKREQKKLIESAQDERPRPYGQAFELPPLNLLDYDAPDVAPIDREHLNDEARKLVKKFKDYGIEGHVREIRPGPVVTTYEFVPAAGTRIARIASLADDLAMAMEAIRVRVVAPIPGKGAVGIEIPNEQRVPVYLKEIISSSEFQRSTSKLAMALGKDIEGHPYQVDLAKMPHMLIAGTTGSGKSVGINAMITSILYKATPDEVRFLMIDPKMLELSIYEGIPHLLLPPVTDPKKAAIALRWAVDEMERRYQLMAENGVRDIKSYNARAIKQQATDSNTDATAGTADKKVIIHDARTETSPASGNGSSDAKPSKPLERLPYIIVVVDEFADLMMVASRDVETYIARLAQKARACGIHLLLATQRPSTDVITGVIKANFPVRLSFQVASNHDSKTIINAYGAEKLLGKGDMLLLPPGSSTLTRCHGAYISEVEIARVVEFLHAQGEPRYDESILKAGDDEQGSSETSAEDYDEHYDAAVAIVAETQQVSISMIQRRLKIGYNRAARIVECMEREGLVGAQLPGNKPREVFARPIPD